MKRWGSWQYITDSVLQTVYYRQCFVGWVIPPGFPVKFCLDFYADLAKEDKIEFALWAGHCPSMEPHLISAGWEAVDVPTWTGGDREDLSGVAKAPKPRLFLAEPQGRECGWTAADSPALILTLPFISCVTLDKIINLAMPISPSLKWRK